MSPSRPASRTAVGRAVAVAVALLLSGCGDSGGLVSAGTTPTASGPTRLWPGEPPASSPPYESVESARSVVKDIKAPGNDIHKVDPVAVVRAEIAAQPYAYSDPRAPYRGTARRMADCRKRSGDRGECPVLKAYYRDLTGDGRDDMVLGFRLLPVNQTAIRMYTFQRDNLVQVLASDSGVTAVELVGRSIIIRSPAGLVGYEYRTQWTWDKDQLSMLLTRDEILRVAGSHAPSRSATP